MVKLDTMEKMFNSMVTTIKESASCNDAVASFQGGIYVVYCEELSGHVQDLVHDCCDVLYETGYLKKLQVSGSYFLIQKAEVM